MTSRTDASPSTVSNLPTSLATTSDYSDMNTINRHTFATSWPRVSGFLLTYLIGFCAGGAELLSLFEDRFGLPSSFTTNYLITILAGIPLMLMLAFDVNLKTLFGRILLYCTAALPVLALSYSLVFDLASSDAPNEVTADGPHVQTTQPALTAVQKRALLGGPIRISLLPLSFTQTTDPTQQVLAIAMPFLVGHQINEVSGAIVTGIFQRRGRDNWYVNPFAVSNAVSAQHVDAEQADYYLTGKLTQDDASISAELLLKTGADDTIIFGETLFLSRASDQSAAVINLSQKLIQAINRHAQSNLTQTSVQALNPIAVNHLAKALIRFWTDPQPTAATRALIRAVELAPNFSDAWLMLAELTDRNADPALWQRAIEMAHQHASSLSKLDQLRADHYYYGFVTPDFAQNKALLETWQIAAPQDPYPRLALALSAREVGDHKSSIQHLARLEADAPAASDALKDRVQHELTHSYLLDQQWDLARARLKAQSPNAESTLLDMARLLINTGQHQKAGVYYEQLLQDDSNNPRYLAAQSLWLMCDGQLETAQTTLQQARGNLLDEDPVIREAEHQFRLYSGQINALIIQIESELRQARAQDNPDQSRFALSQAYLASGDFNQADQLLSNLVNTAAPHLALASQSAQFLLSARQLPEQISSTALTEVGAAYREAANATGSTSAIAFAELLIASETAYRAGNTLNAYSALKFSDQAGAKDWPQALRLSQFALDLGRLREALALADTVLGRCPAMPQANLAAAIAAFKLNQRESALGYVDVALKSLALADARYPGLIQASELRQAILQLKSR